MNAHTTKPPVTINRFVESLRKNAAKGKAISFGILNIPADLRLGTDDYQAITRDAFHNLPENTKVHRLENGMVAFVHAGSWTNDDNTFVEHIREILTDVLNRQGLGHIPTNLWNRFEWPKDQEKLADLLGITLAERPSSDVSVRFDMADMLRGAITTEAVFDSCRRQAIVCFDDTRREVLGHEIYCSLDYLRQNHLASFLLEGPGEIEILSRVLDEKVMDVTAALAPSILPDRLHLNMQIQTVHSDKFTDFIAEHDGKLIENMSPRKMNVDFIKVIWDQNIVGSRRAEVAERLREFAVLFADRSLILTRCDSRTALRMGRSLGVDVFEGSYIDAMLGGYLHRECKSKSRSSDKKCAVCQWAPREARNNGCDFHFRAGKILSDI